MRAHFFMSRIFFRRFAGVAAHLAGEGHEVVAVYNPKEGKMKLLRRLRGVPGISLATCEEVTDEEFGHALLLLRQARNYAWYLNPGQEVGTFNRRRALSHLTDTATRGAMAADPSWPDPVVSLQPEVAAGIDDALAVLDSRIPPEQGLVSFLATTEPDVVLVSPLVRHESHQAEIIKAAQELAIPTAFSVYSWDSLSNKGRIHIVPDRIFAWNELQRREVEELHGIDGERVVVTGASHWDEFFEMEPSQDRNEFCARYELDPDEPIVLYLGSTKTICPDEPSVVDGWLDVLRGSDGPLRRANVLVRSHPNEHAAWEGWTPKHAGVARSEKPKRTSQSLYDQLYHSAVVVGLNTSAQIEAAIVGRPVYTFSAGSAAPAQSGALHFYYLLEGQGGVVSYAETLVEHVAQLERGLAGDFDADAIRTFCEFFVRPHGLDRPVTPIVGEAVIALAASG